MKKFVPYAFIGLLAGCAPLADLATHSGPRALLLTPVVFDEIGERQMPAAKSRHFEVEQAGFVVRPDAEHYPRNAVYAFANFKEIKPFPKTVYQEAVLDNPDNPGKPFVYYAEYTTQSKQSHIGSNVLKNLKIGQTYRITTRFYADPARTQLLDSITQELRSPYDTSGGCLKAELPSGHLLNGILATSGQCVRIW